MLFIPVSVERLASLADSVPERPAGSGRSRRDTHYCARCRRITPTTTVRGHNGARDLTRCNRCMRTWPS